jgi:hypothetical protein
LQSLQDEPEESEPTPIELIREAFEPIQLGQDSVVNKAMELASKKVGKIQPEEQGVKSEIERIKVNAVNTQLAWNYPNEAYIECTGIIMCCDRLLEYLSQKSKDKQN